MKDQSKFDVFISHHAEDRDSARRIASRLHKAGLKVGIYDWEFGPNDLFPEEVSDAIERSRVLILCISPSALASGWVALERTTASHRDPLNSERQFVPILLEECDIPTTLRHYRYLDFREKKNSSFQDLVELCKRRGEVQELASPVHQGYSGSEENHHTPLLSFKQHSGSISYISLSRDQRFALSGSVDGTVYAWSTKSGEIIQKINWQSPISSVAWTPDGKWMLFAAGKSIVVCDSETSTQQSILSDHPDPVVAMATTPCNEKVISVCEDGGVRIWDHDHLKPIGYFRPRSASAIACSIEGNRAVFLSTNGDIGFFDSISLEISSIKQAHAAPGTALEITDDGKYVTSGSADRTVKIWNYETRECLGTFEGHQSPIGSLSITGDGKKVASVGLWDVTVRLWDVESQVCFAEIARAGVTPTSVDFFNDGSFIAVGFTDGEISIFDLNELTKVTNKEGSRRYVNAKVVLIGEGTIGKTSLAHRLIDDTYVIRDRTHGMNVWRLDLPLMPDSTFEREALLWDLAGQEDYRLIHQLFLEHTALAVLLINPQKDDPFSETGDWLKALQSSSLAKEDKLCAAKILVFSQIDVGGLKVSNAKIERFRERNHFSGWVATSAKTGENCSDSANSGKPSKLKHLIADSIPWQSLPWTSTPKLLAALKNAVMALRDDSDIRLLRFSELAQRLKQTYLENPFDESDLRTAVTLLANHGLVHTLKFGDLVLMRPDLINGYAAAVIRSARTHIDEIGCVLEQDIYGENFNFTGVERLGHRPDEELLLRALVQTLLDRALCIAEETTNGRQLVFPSQYRREKDTPKSPDVFVSYTFCGEWQTIWTTLVVRLWYSQQFAGKELWKNAVEFESVKGNILGLLLKVDSDGPCTISLYFDKGVPDELRLVFIEYVHQHLGKYAFNVQRDRRYLCPACQKPVTDLEVVRNRLREGKIFVTCQQCDERVPLVDFIEQRLKSDPIARKILAMDEMATKQLDNQALEQILIGHMMAISGEANQIFRPVTQFDYGIDGEVEFKDNNGRASGRKIYVQLKSGNSYLRTRRTDGREIFDVKNSSHLQYWVSQPVDVYLVVRINDKTGGNVIRWMNVSSYLKNRKKTSSKQIIFDGEKLDMEAIWRVRDDVFLKASKM